MQLLVNGNTLPLNTSAPEVDLSEYLKTTDADTKYASSSHSHSGYASSSHTHSTYATKTQVSKFKEPYELCHQTDTFALIDNVVSSGSGAQKVYCTFKEPRTVSIGFSSTASNNTDIQTDNIVKLTVLTRPSVNEGCCGYDEIYITPSFHNSILTVTATLAFHIVDSTYSNTVSVSKSSNTLSTVSISSSSSYQRVFNLYYKRYDGYAWYQDEL